MSCPFLLVLGLLSFKADSSVQSERVVAFAGGEVILPCSVKNTANNDLFDFEWSKEGLKPDVVFLYRDGCETFEMKHPDFEFWTSPFMREVKNGNISLRISDVKLSDAGKYKCLILPKNARRTETTMELVVVAASEPRLSVVSADSGTVTVQCEASCWRPEPLMEVLDGQRNNITAEEPEREHNRGCYTTRQTVTLKSPTNRVICKVYQHEFNQTKSAEIIIPADHLKSNPFYIASLVGWMGLVCFTISVIFWFLRNGKQCKCAKGKLLLKKTASNQSTQSDCFERCDSEVPLDPTGKSHMADNMGNGVIQQWEELDGLKEEISKKNEIIQQLEINIRSQKRHIDCQHDQPTMVQSPSKSPPLTIKSSSQSVDLSTETSNSTSEQTPELAASMNRNSVRPSKSHKTKVPKLETEGPISIPAFSLKLRQRRSSSVSSLSDLVTSELPKKQEISVRSSSDPCSQFYLNKDFCKPKYKIPASAYCPNNSLTKVNKY